jgi:hypothetical protein
MGVERFSLNMKTGMQVYNKTETSFDNLNYLRI